MASNSRKRLGMIADLLGGLSGNAAKSLRDRQKKLDSAFSAMEKGDVPIGRKKKKKKNKSILDSLIGE